MGEDIMNEILKSAGCDDMLVEMADIMSSDQQRGFLLSVFSKDHEPPHAHVRDLNGETIGLILITDAAPQQPEDIQLYRTDRLSSDIKKEIVLWANETDPDFGCTYWTTMKNFWKRFQASRARKK